MAANSSIGRLKRDLARLAMMLIAMTLLAAGVCGALMSGTARRDVLASLAVVIAAVLIGFVPLRRMLRHGPDNIVAGVIAGMILRMAVCLIGLVVLLKKYEMSTQLCVLTVSGGYLVLLAAETIGLNRLIRNAFDRQTQQVREPN